MSESLNHAHNPIKLYISDVDVLLMLLGVVVRDYFTVLLSAVCLLSPEMPKASAIEEELDDGGFIARSGKPLPQFSPQSGPLNSSLLGNRNRKRNYGGREAAAPLSGKQGKSAVEANRVDTARCELVLNSASENEESPTDDRKQMVTLTGTIKRGRKQDHVVEVKFEISEKELTRLNSKPTDRSKEKSCTPGPKQGPHILLFTLLFSPFAFLASIFTTFYIGTLCWYNVYLYVSEERTIWHKIFFCPMLLIVYPILITVSTLCLSMFAAVKQVSWCLSSWCRELRDYDKGFFVWLCNALNVPQCAPYEVVILDEAPLASENVTPEQSCGLPNQAVQCNV